MTGKMYAVHFLACTILAALVHAFTRHGYEYLAFVVGYWFILYVHYEVRR